MTKEIYLAGGCFWGVEAYMERLKGVVSATVGYANGKFDNPAYEDLVYRNSGHAETVHVTYDSAVLPLSRLLQYYYRIIDPTSLNKQGNDIGSQYRTGVYYTDEDDLPVIRASVSQLQAKLKQSVQIEVTPLVRYDLAEEYHQDYLAKNPGGYCHVNLDLADEPLVDEVRYSKPDQDAIRAMLTDLQYQVTQENGTERPFQNEFWDQHDEGIYVDIVTGEPLFSSLDKFDSACGWPSFSKAIEDEVVIYKTDQSHGMTRTEVRSREGDSHLGHVFEDGPEETGGLRYCINSASLRFVSRAKMEAEGYADLLSIFEKKAE